VSGAQDKGKGKKATKTKLKTGAKEEVTIELVKEYYLVVSFRGGKR